MPVLTTFKQRSVTSEKVNQVDEITSVITSHFGKKYTL